MAINSYSKSYRDATLALSLQKNMKKALSEIIRRKSDNKEINIFGDGGHSLYIRFDEKNRRYIFRDPNFLTAELKDVDKVEGIKWLQEVLMQLLSNYYHDTSLIIPANITFSAE